MIRKYGQSHPLPGAAVQPDPNLDYKLLFNIIKEAGDPNKVSPGFNHVARTINVFEGAGYPLERMQIVAVVHGKAIDSVLNDEQYRKKYSQSNPNTDLLRQLSQAGVEVYLCGQSMIEHQYDQSMISSDITLALSALTVLSTYQLRGYALMPD